MINRFGPPMGGPGPFAPDDEEQARAIYRVRLMADLGLLPRLPGFQSPFGAGFGGAVDSAGMPRAPQAFSTALGGGQFASPVHPMSPGAQGGLWPRDDPGRAGLLSPADGDGRPMAPHEYGERILDPEPHHPGSRLAQPAADDVSPPFGVMVRRSENAREDPGLVSPGRGDHGGRSYGLYQLSSRRPDGGGLSPVERFIDASGYGPFFQGMEVNSERFRNQWRDLAGADPSFVQAQHEYMRSEYYHPAAQALERSGLALEGRGEGLREVVFSTAVQYGGIGVIRRALRGRDPSTMSDEELIVAIQDDKLANVDRDFRSSNAEIRDGVRERIPREREQALRMTREGRPPVGPPGR